jgi:hypothetical protein
VDTPGVAVLTLTAFPPGTTVAVVERTHGNEEIADYAPDPQVPAAIVARPPEELGPILRTVVTDDQGRTVVGGLTRGSGAGLPTTRYFALGQLPDGSWQRVPFSATGMDVS